MIDKKKMVWRADLLPGKQPAPKHGPVHAVSLGQAVGESVVTQVTDPRPDAPVGEADGATEAGWHSIESFLRCPKEYQYQHVRGIISPTAATPDYFAIGQLFHIGKAGWFAARFATDEARMLSIREKMSAYAARAKLPISNEALTRAHGYFDEYVKHYRIRPKPDVLAAEYFIGPATLIKGDTFFVARTARLDDVSKYPEAGHKLAIGEAKSTSGSINDVVQQYMLHGQPLLQMALWETAPQGEAMHGPIAGVVLDVLSKGYGNKASKFGRIFIPKPQRAIEWFVKNLNTQLRAAALVEWNTDAPRNISSCTRMIGRARVECPYLKLCRWGRAGSAPYTFKDGNGLGRWLPSTSQSTPPWE